MTWTNDNRGSRGRTSDAVAARSATGAVTVSPNIVDPDGDWLTFTVDAPFPRRGVLWLPCSHFLEGT